MIKVIALRTFDRAVKKLMSSSDIATLAHMLQENPEVGDIIKGSGGIRKVRFATHRGKSGGLRVIYFFQDKEGKIFLITAYAKNKKEDLTDAEINALRKLTLELKREE